MRWLHLQIHAPLISFGAVTIDSIGHITPFPAQSMLTGLFANALGWERVMWEEHQALQDRLVYGVMWDSHPETIMDYQIAQLEKRKLWTTEGSYPIRDKATTMERRRDYFADASLSIVLRLIQTGASPTLDDLAVALQKPHRPLFIGRKSCLPSRPLYLGMLDAGEGVCSALQSLVKEKQGEFLSFWPSEERDVHSQREWEVSDWKDWNSGYHGGVRHLSEGRIQGGLP